MRERLLTDDRPSPAAPPLPTPAAPRAAGDADLGRAPRSGWEHGGGGGSGRLIARLRAACGTEERARVRAAVEEAALVAQARRGKGVAGVGWL